MLAIRIMSARARPVPVADVREHGREHVVVGEVTTTVVRVVRDEDVALAELVDTEELEREPDRQRRREHELRDADRQRCEASARSRIVALRSFDWLRMGVVAVRDTYVAISKQIVSIAPRTTSAVTGSTVGASLMRPRLLASSTRSTYVMVPSSSPDVSVTNLTLASRILPPAAIGSLPLFRSRRAARAGPLGPRLPAPQGTCGAVGSLPPWSCRAPSTSTSACWRTASRRTPPSRRA